MSSPCGSAAVLAAMPSEPVVVIGVLVLFVALVALVVYLVRKPNHWVWLGCGAVAGLVLAVGLGLAHNSLAIVGGILIGLPLLFLAVVFGNRLIEWVRRLMGIEKKNLEPDLGSFVSSGLVVLLALAMVAVVSAWAGNRDKVDGLPAVPVVHLAEGGTYVALGDSYSAGEGLSPYLPPTGDKDKGGNDCHQSNSAFAEQLKFDVKSGEPVHLHLVACSGARDGNAFLVAQHTVPGQPSQTQVGDSTSSPGSAQYVFKGNERLVTLTMGGNDAHFSDVLKFCAEHSHCLSGMFSVNPGPDEPDSIKVRQPLSAWAAALLPQLKTKLATLYTRLRHDAGQDARIIVVGYPQLLPDQTHAGGTACHVLLGHLDPGERKGLRDLETTLNDDIYHAAVASGVEYVDPNGLWAGHEACGPDGQLIHNIPPAISGYVSRARSTRAPRANSCSRSRWPATWISIRMR